jgi:hypothetical protein
MDVGKLQRKRRQYRRLGWQAQAHHRRAALPDRWPHRPKDLLARPAAHLHQEFGLAVQPPIRRSMPAQVAVQPLERLELPGGRVQADLVIGQEGAARLLRQPPAPPVRPLEVEHLKLKQRHNRSSRAEATHIPQAAYSGPLSHKPPRKGRRAASRGHSAILGPILGITDMRETVV